MAIINLDEDLENADWTKQSNDLPEGEELEKFLLSMKMTMTEFKKLPAYYLPKRKK